MRVTPARFARTVVGHRPRLLLWLVVPTGLALLVDLVLRGAQLAGYALQGEAIYASSLLVSAAFWALPLWAAARLHEARSIRARIASASLIGLWLFPFATLGFAGQLLYYRVFHLYMGRDTLRLGIALRGTVGEWFDAWGGAWLVVAMMAAGGLVTAVAVRAARLAAPAAVPPLLLVVTFAGSLVCLWVDGVDSRFLQAATPDVCFAHSVVHAVRMAVTGQWKRRQGVSLRTPAPLPPLAASRSRPNVLVVLTESVRADATCSEPPPGCRDPYLDEVAPDRIPLAS